MVVVGVVVKIIIPHPFTDSANGWDESVAGAMLLAFLAEAEDPRANHIICYLGYCR
jgi:hypothetical protein